MRQRASLLASLEGISRTAFLLAKELSQNSRSGLTPRFLAKKLDLSLEEVEYLVDVNSKLLFMDLTKIRLAPEGFPAVKRILDGLESHGDAAALAAKIRTLPDHDLQVLEERLGLEDAIPKKELVERALSHIYRHPDAVLHYVASQDFSAHARDIFDLLWQSKDGIMRVSQLHSAFGGNEYAVEQGLWELFQGGACFELFRFDAEDRLTRAAALLKEVRDYRKSMTLSQSAPEKGRLSSVKHPDAPIVAEELSFSDVVCRLTAAIAAHPVRLRNDGDLFAEDRRRLEEIRAEEDEPSLNTCLWAAEGLNWIVRVDNMLHTGDVEALLPLNRVERHRRLYEWLTAQGDEALSRGILQDMCEYIKPDVWYRVMDFLAFAKSLFDHAEAPQIRQAGAHYEYISPSASSRVEMRLARSLEETMAWLGVVERSYADGEACFRISPLGMALLTGAAPDSLLARYPQQNSTLLVQPNYEIVTAPEEMDPLLTAPLECFASRVASGNAIVYKLTRERFIKAMQEGRQADAFIEFLLNHSQRELPENVLITLRDWRGAAKAVRIRSYQVIEADDPLVIAELEHNKRWRNCLHPLETRKALRYQGMSRAELKRALEKEGYIVKQ